MDRLKKRRLLLSGGTTLLTFFVCTWTALEWDVYQTEKRVWNLGDFSHLDKRQHVYGWVAERRLARPGLKSRLWGLLGDLRYSEQKYEESHALYGQFLETRSVRYDQIEAFFSQIKEHSPFMQGFRASSSASFSKAPLDDGDLFLQTHELPDSQNSRFDLKTIASVEESDVSIIGDLYQRMGDWDYDDKESIQRLVSKYRDTLIRISDLDERFALEESDWEPVFDPLVKAINLARLSGIDAFFQAGMGNTMQARASLDTCYRLIGFAEQSPGLVSALMVCSLRNPLIEALSRPSGEIVAPHFSRVHELNSDFFERSIKGEYTRASRILRYVIPPTDPAEEQRVFYTASQRNIAYWRSALSGEPTSVNFDEEMSHWYFRNRHFLVRQNLTSYVEGERLADEVVELRALNLFLLTVPKVGPLKDSLEEIRVAEQKLLQELGK